MIAAAPAETPLRLLVVEDSEHDAVLAVAEMRRAGVAVEWRRVETERDLRAALVDFAPDVVLSDYSIPGFGGMAALEVCCSEAPEIPFLVCTGSTNEETAVECMKAGAWDYVVKDRPARLPRAVVAALDLARTRQEKRRAGDAVRRSEALLRQSSERYRTLFEQSPVSIWEEDFSAVRERLEELRAAGVTDWAAHLDAHPEDLLDLACRVRVLDVNETSLRVFGVERKADLLGSLERYFDEASYPVFREEMVALAEGATRIDLELPIRDAHGARRIVSLSLSVVPGCEETLDRVLVSFVDVTEERSLQAQLAQAQKMEAVGRLAGGVAHDFNNLLAVIHGHGEMAQSLAADQPAVQDRIAHMLAAAERAAALTRQLLAFSRRQPLRLVRVDLNDVVSDTLRMLRRLIGEDVEVETSLAGEAVPVDADAAQIGQVLVNLALNARDAMPSGGRLTIATRRIDADAAFVASRPGMAPGRYAALSVRDTGTGIDPEVLGHLFEPFFTTKPEGRGTGLGLSTAYGVVRQSGGHVSVRSERGHGTEFTVHLPLAESAAPPEAAAAPAACGGTETILVAEDQEALRELVVEMLSDAGYTVLAASDGGSALERARRHDGPLDLVVTDVVMPCAGGPELAERLRALRPGLRVLYTSGYTADVIERSGLGGEEVPLLGKPFTRAELLDAVRGALAG